MLKEQRCRAHYNFDDVINVINLLFFLGLALAIVRGVAPLSTIELARMEKKVCLAF